MHIRVAPYMISFGASSNFLTSFQAGSILTLQRKRGCYISWWRHQMETFSALLAICAGNSPVPGEFPTQRPVTRSFNVFFDLRLNKRLSKQSWGWWLETLSRPLWRHCNVHGSQVVLHDIVFFLEVSLPIYSLSKQGQYNISITQTIVLTRN